VTLEPLSPGPGATISRGAGLRPEASSRQDVMLKEKFRRGWGYLVGVLEYLPTV